MRTQILADIPFLVGVSAFCFYVSTETSQKSPAASSGGCGGGENGSRAGMECIVENWRNGA